MKFKRADRNYFCEASIWASVPPTEDNILLLENVDLSFDSAVIGITKQLTRIDYIWLRSSTMAIISHFTCNQNIFGVAKCKAISLEFDK